MVAKARPVEVGGCGQRAGSPWRRAWSKAGEGSWARIRWETLCSQWVCRISARVSRATNCPFVPDCVFKNVGKANSLGEIKTVPLLSSRWRIFLLSNTLGQMRGCLQPSVSGSGSLCLGLLGCAAAPLCAPSRDPLLRPHGPEGHRGGTQL